ncbi:von Willebrand factor type A [Pirellula staleyi DSM 6068]|uniref:von Willebrand factor type A n=1 Tax=Pirellula staleyi (strain ATCC 27377 / DSM 6068 / ICPB 4128) TaxID=530564 RepID=D2QZK1_PIRSD|nr:vWA domain-containing protein [Pirellula staleyi]ADB16484.1 von Willebrand factor type A [Pirellula staleyi DSM 6068]
MASQQSASSRGASAKRGGWKGATTTVVETPHRWQSGAAPGRTTAGPTWGRYRRTRVMILGIISIWLIGLLVWYLLFRPAMTPMVTVVATRYDMPLPPNSWATEDLRGIKELDSQTLRLFDGSAAWESEERGIRQLEQHLKSAKPRIERSGMLMLYWSMPGCVDDEGQPCFIPPGASPHRSETWLPLADVLEEIKKQDLPTSVHKLMILDVSRERANWSVGMLTTTFPAAVEKVVNQSGIPNLAILLSASPGQAAVASTELRGTVFGRAMTIGLAGAADARASGGNGNGRVSLHELLHYTTDRVEKWTKAHRGLPQQPMLVPSTTPDVNLAYAMSTSSWRKLDAQSKRQESAPPVVAVATLTKLWKTHDRLAAERVYRFDPIGWRHFQHQLLRLEQLTTAGDAYRQQAIDLATQLSSQCDALDSRLAAAMVRPSIFSYSQVMTPTPDKLSPGRSLPSLGTADLLASVVPQQSRLVREQLSLVASQPTENGIVEALRVIEEAKLPTDPVEVHFLRLVARFHVPQLWSSSTVVGKAIDVRRRASELAIQRGDITLLGDERAYALSRGERIDSDRARRMAEDLLLAGNAAAGVDASSLYTSAETALASSQQAYLDAAISLASRDEAWSEAIYFAKWLAEPQTSQADQRSADDAIRTELLPMISALRRFDEATSRSENQDVTSSRFDATSSAQLTAAHRALHERLKKAIAAATGGKGTDAANVNKLENLLTLPMIPWLQRDALRRKLTETLGELETLAAAPPVPKTGEEQVAEPPADQMARLESSWTVHPLIAALSLESEASIVASDPLPGSTDKPAVTTPTSIEAPVSQANPTTPPALDLSLPTSPDIAIDGELFSADGKVETKEFATSQTADAPKPQATAQEKGEKSDPEATNPSQLFATLDKQAAVIRARLMRLSAPELIVLPELAASATESSVRTRASLSGWSDLCKTDSLLRAAAPLWFPAPVDDPIGRLRSRDLQQLLLAEADRALVDFYGPPAPRREPFFATATSQLLSLAREIDPPTTTIQSQFEQLGDLLNRRTEAARSAVAVSASDILLIDQTPSVTSQVRISAPVPAIAASLPEAEAAIYFTDDQGRVGSTARILDTKSLMTQSNPVAWESVFVAAGLESRGPLMAAVANVRGNEFAAPLLLRAAGGKRIEFAKPTYGPPTVTIHGFRRRQASVVFVLDCSHTMKALDEVESPDGGVRATSQRMELAKGALRSMLTQLAERGDARVGVRFFGHRVGWSTVEANKLLRQNRYAGEIPPELQPYADVENILPLGRFDSVIAGRVFEAMKTVEPWGESPIYLSITEALRDFAQEDGESEKSIVVITDGKNYQFNAPSQLARTKDDVLAARGSRDIKVHIVGFNIEPSESEVASREFREIAEATGGEFLPATSAGSLVRSLESVLRAAEFTVASTGDGSSQSARIGSTLTLPKINAPQTFAAEFEAAKQELLLSGGEAVELNVARNGTRLEVPPFLKGSPKFVRLAPVVRGQATGIQVGIHRPVRQEGRVIVPMSLQDSDQYFVTRPVEWWVEVRPRQASSESEPSGYYFYDPIYEAEKSVPLWNCVANNWPTSARQAEITTFCKFAKTNPTVAIPLLEVAGTPPPSPAGFPVEGMTGVTYQARYVHDEASGRLQVGIVERHSSSSLGVGSLKVSLSLSPKSAVHQFDSENGIVLHTFDFERVPTADLGSMVIHFTSREDLRSGAIELTEPVILDIADRSDLIGPQPITNEQTTGGIR